MRKTPDRWLGLEIRARKSSSGEGIASSFKMGAQFRVPPAIPDNVSGRSLIGAALFEWAPVTRTASGKPLEAFARYAVFYKISTSTPIPIINIFDPATYDGVIFVDNTQVNISLGRQYVSPPGEWRDERVAIRVVAIDRQGRRSNPSTQVETAPTTAKIPQILDVGYISSYQPDDIQRTKVWDFSSFVVPDGYQLVATIWPVWGAFVIPGDMNADVFGKAEQHFYGLFFASELPSQGVSVLEPGNYTNLRLYIYHYHYGEGYFSCYQLTPFLADVPLYRFDYFQPGNMYLEGFLTEAMPSNMVLVSQEGFQQVLWMVWRVPK